MNEVAVKYEIFLMELLSRRILNAEFLKIQYRYVNRNVY